MTFRSSTGVISMMFAGASAGAHSAALATCAQLTALKLPDTTIIRADVVGERI